MKAEPGLPRITQADLKVLARCRAIEQRIHERAELLGKHDPSWRGPGDTGLRHWWAASDPQARLGQAFYG